MKYLAVLCTFGLCVSVAPVMAAPVGTTALAATSRTLQPGGILDIQVAGEPTLSKDYLVDAAGHITMEMIGQVTVAGRTPDQIAEELRSRLKLYLKEPDVTVSEITPLRQSIVVTVAGDVMKSGAVQLRPGDTLLEALAAVGGPGPNADSAHAMVVRRGQAQPIAVNLDRLTEGDLSQNVSLQDGDVLRVPKQELPTFQVEGEVKLPGRKALASGTRVLDVLSTVGLTDRADRNRITITHPNQSTPMVIDLDKVLSGETSANVLLQPGDVLTVASRIAVQVVGDVRTASQPLLRNGATLMEAIQFAGGFGPNADRAAIEITHNDGTTQKASLADVTGVVGGPVLRPGDLIMVQSVKPEFVTLFGAFRSTAPLPYRSGMQITDALMTAGLLDNAQWKQIRVLRGGEGAGRKILSFNLEAYLKTPQTKNIALEPGDQIVAEVQRQGGPSLLQRLMELTPLASLYFYIKH